MKDSEKMDFSAGRNDSSCKKTNSVKTAKVKNRKAYERLIAMREEKEL